MILGMKMRNQDFDTSTCKIIEYNIWLELRIQECYNCPKSLLHLSCLFHPLSNMFSTITRKDHITNKNERRYDSQVVAK